LKAAHQLTLEVIIFRANGAITICHATLSPLRLPNTWISCEDRATLLTRRGPRQLLHCSAARASPEPHATRAQVATVAPTDRTKVIATWLACQ
jgi:hypothetical protein